MDTKICRGILHPEGVELPVSNFGTRKTYHICTDGHKTIHTYYKPYCHKCACEQVKAYQRANPDQTKATRKRYYTSQKGIEYHRNYDKSEKGRRMHRKWATSEFGRISLRNAAHKWQANNPEKIQEYARKNRIILHDLYIKDTLTNIGYKTEEIYPELIRLKRAQLRLYRKALSIKPVKM